ncbi:MAG: BatA domain-containing protein, partial [Alphaproteobacteria bacterium]|nr:BatA domain-containing protein [Alphaproteobacteria bacterium]
MTGIGALAFLSPLWLAALAALPILWWLLRVTPPAPKHVAFPAIALLLKLK